MYDYMTGSLEHRATAESVYALEMMGIREHAREILDGGEEEFQKRAEKYKISGCRGVTLALLVAFQYGRC